MCHADALNAGPAPGEDELVDRVAAAALDQFAEYGIRRSTIDDVARRAGVSKMTVFRRFQNKQGLVEVVIAREIRRGMAELDRAWERQDTLEESPRPGLRVRGALRPRPPAVRPSAAQRARAPAAPDHRRRRTCTRALPIADRTIGCVPR